MTENRCPHCDRWESPQLVSPPGPGNQYRCNNHTYVRTATYTWHDTDEISQTVWLENDGESFGYSPEEARQVAKLLVEAADKLEPPTPPKYLLPRRYRA